MLPSEPDDVPFFFWHCQDRAATLDANRNHTSQNRPHVIKLSRINALDVFYKH